MASDVKDIVRNDVSLVNHSSTWLSIRKGHLLLYKTVNNQLLLCHVMLYFIIKIMYKTPE